MSLTKLCTPAFVYMAFSLTGVATDLVSGVYGAATSKAIVGVVITLLLNALCKRGFAILAWLIVLVPFALMTLIIAMLVVSGAVGGNMQSIGGGTIEVNN